MALRERRARQRGAGPVDAHEPQAHLAWCWVACRWSCSPSFSSEGACDDSRAPARTGLRTRARTSTRRSTRSAPCRRTPHEPQDSDAYATRVEAAFGAGVRRNPPARAPDCRGHLSGVRGGRNHSLDRRPRCARRPAVAGQLSAFVFYSVIVATSVGAISEVAGELQRAAGATERLLEILDTPPEIAAPALPVDLPEPARGTVALNAVTFAYPSRPSDPALSVLSLEVGRGGARGAGRSLRRGQDHGVPVACCVSTIRSPARC